MKKKYALTGKNVFMFVVLLANMDGKWDDMAFLWNIKPAMYQSMIVKVIKVVAHHMYDIITNILQTGE